MTSTSSVSLTCEKCQGGMDRTKVRRFSSGLVALGYVLLVPALLIMIGTTGCAVLSTVTAGKSLGSNTNHAQAVEELRAVRGLAPTVISEFERTSTLTSETLNALAADQRRDVDFILSMFASRQAGTALGATAVTGVSWLLVLLVFFLCVPTFIIGLVLTMRKKVWRCHQCGYVFERA